MDYHYVRERVALSSLVVKHISAQIQLADIFTKSLPTALFWNLRIKLRVDIPPIHSLRGVLTQATRFRQRLKTTFRKESDSVQVNSSPLSFSLSQIKSFPMDTILNDKNRERKEKRRGKQIATSSTKPLDH